MNGGKYRASATIQATGAKDPQGVHILDSTIRDATATGSGSGEQSLLYGTGSGCFDILISQPRGLGALASETLDLYAGTSLLNLFGESTPLRTVKGMVVYIVSGGDASGLRIGGAASQAWTGFFADGSDKIDIFPGGPPLALGKPAGVTVGSTTNNLKIENLGAVSVVYRLILAGSSAVGGAPMGMLLSLTYP